VFLKLQADVLPTGHESMFLVLYKGMLSFLSDGVDEGVILHNGFLKDMTFRERVLALACPSFASSPSSPVSFYLTVRSLC